MDDRVKVNIKPKLLQAPPAMTAKTAAPGTTATRSVRGTWTCKLCLKELKTKQSYDYHVSHQVCRKNFCMHCKHCFKTAQSYRYHRDHRVCLGTKKIPVEIKLNPDGLIKSCRRTVPYSQIDFDQLVKDEPNLFSTIFNQSTEAIVPKFIDLILCNPKMPDNWSFLVNSKAGDNISVYNPERDRYDTKTASPVLLELMQWAIAKLNYISVNYMHLITDQQIEDFEKTRLILSNMENKGILSSVLQEMYLTLYNHRNEMKKKIKNIRSREMLSA